MKRHLFRVLVVGVALLSVQGLRAVCFYESDRECYEELCRPYGGADFSKTYAVHGGLLSLPCKELGVSAVCEEKRAWVAHKLIDQRRHA